MQHPILSNSRTLFIGLTSTLTFALLVVVCIFSKSTSFIAANIYHTGWMDKMFLMITNMGDGSFALLLAVAFFIFKKRNISLKIILTFLLSGFVAQMLKHLFHAPRPKAFFPPGAYNHFIEGVTNSGLTSFPSGHATTAFAVASILSFNITCKKWCSILFTLACLTIYSRIYLGQHFIEDVLAGMILGIFTSMLVEHIFDRYFLRKSQPGKMQLNDHEPLSIEL